MKRILIVLISGLFLSLTLVGCGPSAGYQSALVQVNKGEAVPPVGGNEKPEPTECEAPQTMYQLDTKMLAFEITSQNQFKFGFDIAKGWFEFFKTNFKAITGRLNLEMTLVDALDPNKEIAHGKGESKMSKREFSFNFGIKEFGISFEHFSKTPVAKLTEKGLGQGLGQLKKNFDGKAEEWSAVVRGVVNNSNDVIVSAGTTSNLKRGDVLAFYNIKHEWIGVPCQSDYLFRRRTTDEPIAYGEVIDILNHAAQVRLDSSEGLVEFGAKAVVHELTDSKRRLFQPLMIASVEGGELKIDDEDESQVDITPYLEMQISRMAASKGFVIHKKAKN